MVFKNPKTDKWEVRCYYKTYKGERKQKTKRGFRTKSEALDWERHFKLQDHQDLDMTIEDFFELPFINRLAARRTAHRQIVVLCQIL